jgi:hypothetical protein
MLERLIPQFRATKINHREKIVKEAAGHIKSMWTEGVEFDRGVVTSVCDLSTRLDLSQTFLAYSRVHVWQG